MLNNPFTKALRGWVPWDSHEIVHVHWTASMQMKRQLSFMGWQMWDEHILHIYIYIQLYTSMQWTFNRNYSSKSCGFPHDFFPKLTPPQKKTTNVFPTQTPSCTWRSSKVWKPKSHQVIKKSTVFQATTWVVGETSFQQPIPLADRHCCCSGVPQLQGDSFGSWKHHQWGPIRICAFRKIPTCFESHVIVHLTHRIHGI